MKIFTRLLTVMVLSCVLWMGCGKEGPAETGKTPLGLGDLSVEVSGNVSRGLSAADFFEEGDRIRVSASASGLPDRTGSYTFNSNGGWDITVPLYFEDVYDGVSTPYSFSLSFGEQALTTDQKTAEKYHAADYLTGTATLDAQTRRLNASADLTHGHVRLAVTVNKGDYWADDAAFVAHIDAATIRLLTKEGTTVVPVVTSSAGSYTFTAIIPLEKMSSASGEAVLKLITAGGSERLLKLLSNVTGLTKGVSLSVTVTYDQLMMFGGVRVEMIPWNEVDGGQLPGRTPAELAERDRFIAWANDAEGGWNSPDNKNFKLATDIDLTGIDLTPIGNINDAYSGTFDGNGKTIAGLTIDAATDYTGLFAVIGQDGTVKNLTIADADVKTGDMVGIIGGWNSGLILGCTVKNSRVEGKYDVEAIAGHQEGVVAGCTVGNCVVVATGTSRSSGGIAGVNDSPPEIAGINDDSPGTIVGCHATDVVVQGGDSGGIVGYNNMKVVGCYATKVSVDDSDNYGVLIGKNATSGTASACCWIATEVITKAIGGNNLQQETNCVKISGTGLSDENVSTMNVAIKAYNQSASASLRCDCRWTTAGIVPGAPR